MSDASEEIEFAFSGLLSRYYFLLGIQSPFLWGEDLLRSEGLEDVKPYLQKYWTQLLLDVLAEVLRKIDKRV